MVLCDKCSSVVRSSSLPCVCLHAQFDSSSVEVNLQIVLVEPGHPKDHALFPKLGDRKQDAFRVAVICHDHVNNFVDASSFVQHSINIVNGDWLGQLSHWKFGLVDKFLINKVSSCTSIIHGFSGSFFHGVCHLKVDWDHNAPQIFLQ